ncbi:MAG: FKBP-type peptidyl-prolyl cis-trans isomerase [Acidobacteria bacterium]|nr:FKBP-type peptidyl-prolyl cis-trans isomerase [Acidobacteriota bacterium]
MKKILPAALLPIVICSSVSFAQTRTGRRTARKTTTGKKYAPPRKKKMENTNNAVTTPSGLTYIITKHGTGREVKAGDTVEVNYTGLLTNGAMFDSSLNRNETFSFRVGAGMVIKGWDEGLQHLRVGDHATLILPPGIAYGERGAGGVIPPNATLIFIIEVVGVK